MGVVHWDEVDSFRVAKGEMAASWRRLGRAAGSEGVGVTRIDVEPGRMSTPPHSHGASEEHYYVLGGSGQAWQDGTLLAIRPGHCVIHRAKEMEHTFRAGPDGLELLVFGTNSPAELGWLPRPGSVRLGWPWVPGRADHPWELEAEDEPLEGEPADAAPNVVHLDDVEEHRDGGERWKALAATAGSKQAGLGWSALDPGRIASPPHCHSEEEEVFVLLDGEATLELSPSPMAADRGDVREDVPVRAGHVVARPPGTRVGHAFRAGPAGVTMLVYGTRRPNDICYYPRSNKIAWRGVGVIGRIESLDYWDGEPRD